MNVLRGLAYIAVIGAGDASDELYCQAREVGRLVTERFSYAGQVAESVGDARSGERTGEMRIR